MKRREFNSADFLELAVTCTSQGNQRKFVSKDGKYFVKMRHSRGCKDDLVEVIASTLGEQFGFQCVRQYLGAVDGEECCYSEFFEGKFVPYKKLDPTKELFDYNDPIDQLKFAIDRMEKKTGATCKKYFYEMLLLDYLVCNEDRHLGNFGVLQSKTITVAPLFDFGMGLFESYKHSGRTLQEAEEKVTRKPFGNQLPLIEWLEREHKQSRPTTAKLENLTFPNRLADEWLQQALTRLEIEWR